MNRRNFIPSWPDFVSSSARYLQLFLKNPLQGIKSLPDWNWLELIVLLGVFSALSGVLSGAVKLSFTQTFAGLILLPISALVFCCLVVGFTYYVAFFVLKRDMDLRRLSTLVVLASIPSLAIHPLVNLLPPFFFIGFLLSLAVFGIGLHHHFMIERKHIYRMSGFLFLVVLGIWITQQISHFQKRDVIESIANPESLDILERELKSTD